MEVANINYPTCSICGKQHVPWETVKTLRGQFTDLETRVGRLEQGTREAVAGLLAETHTRTARMQENVRELLAELRTARGGVGWDLMLPEDTEDTGVGWVLLGALRDMDGRLTHGLTALLALIECGK